MTTSRAGRSGVCTGVQRATLDAGLALKVEDWWLTPLSAPRCDVINTPYLLTRSRSAATPEACMLAGLTMLSSSTSASAIARPASLKVYYGDMPFWRAEVVRLALFMGDVPFEDVRDQKRVDLIVRAHTCSKPFPRLNPHCSAFHARRRQAS